MLIDITEYQQAIMIDFKKLWEILKLNKDWEFLQSKCRNTEFLVAVRNYYYGKKEKDSNNSRPKHLNHSVSN